MKDSLVPYNNKDKNVVPKSNNIDMPYKRDLPEKVSLKDTKPKLPETHRERQTDIEHAKPTHRSNQTPVRSEPVRKKINRSDATDKEEKDEFGPIALTLIIILCIVSWGVIIYGIYELILAIIDDYESVLGTLVIIVIIGAICAYYAWVADNRSSNTTTDTKQKDADEHIITQQTLIIRQTRINRFDKK